MKRTARGNTILEYAVPMALLLLAGGFLASVVDIKTILSEYFMSGSGYTTSALSGGTFKTSSMPKAATSSAGTGSETMTALGSLTDGGGGSVPSTGLNFSSAGILQRSGPPAAPSTTETLF